MPYSSTSELSSPVRSRYSDKCQRAYMHAFNSVHGSTGDEGRAAAAGHAAAQKCEGKMTDELDVTLAAWDSAYITALPDSAFACPEQRKYPHHDKSGAVDPAHLRAALSRVGDPSNDQCGKAHLEAHAKAMGMGDRKNIIGPEVELNVKPVVFKMFTGLLKTYRDEEQRRMFKGVASSTIADRAGHSMERTAIEDMVRDANQNLTIFLNHRYEVPEDVAGSVRAAQARLAGHDEEGAEIWDLDYDVAINESNDRAVKSWEAIDGGTKLGMSIGAMVPVGGAEVNRKTGAVRFHHIELLETSIVGLPANPRSWISSAVKAIDSLDDLVTDHFQVVGEDGPEQIALAAATCGAQSDSDQPCSKPAGHKGMHSWQSSAEPEVTADETPEAPATEDLPETEAPEGDSQEAAQDSEPESETVEVEEPVADSLLNESDDAHAFAMALPTTLQLLERVTGQLVEARQAIVAAETERDQARRERDDAVLMSQQLLDGTNQILVKLADVPLGRRAIVQEASHEFNSLERIYGPEIMKLMKGKPNGN